MRLAHTDRRRLALLVVLAAAVTVFTATVPLLRDWFDLRVYHGTVDSWIHHGGRIYDYRVPGTTYGFTYPPFAAVVMLPMALVELHTAIAVALLLDVAALAFVLYVLADRVWRRHGWYGCALAVCALALFEPLRDTFSFGQVNILLLALVLLDCRLLTTGRHRWAGVGIGLAAAIKLTPAAFIGLLLVARRGRTAAVATAVATAATALAAWTVPEASRFYWTHAMWDTTRVGRLDYVSNQSLQGVLARLGVMDRGWWAALVLVALGVWAARTRRAVAAGDWTAAFALTGLAACLISPITWVHHLVWLLPSFAVLVRAGRPWVAGALYAVLCTSVVWLWFDDASGADGFVGSNIYVWITLGLLLRLPVAQSCSARSTPLPRSTSDVAPAPIPAAPAIAQASAQPALATPPAPPRAAACEAGSGTGPGLGLARKASSDPTGSTRPAAANPQSSSSPASS
ncbi:glycosyltransferase 87 family protein [Streptomyces sp. NPDC001920]